MRLSFAKTKLHRRHFYAPSIPFVGVYALLLLFGFAILSVDASYVAEADAQKGVLDPAKIEFPPYNHDNIIKNLGVALQRHNNGRIKTYFKAGQVWPVGENAMLSVVESDISKGTYAADKGITITLLDEEGNQEFWVNAEKACLVGNKNIGKCFGFVKLESPELEIYGTNLLWTTVSTNLFTIEKNATLRIKDLDSNVLEGNK